MAIELPDGTVVRNIPEQVAYLTEANERLAQQLQMALSGVMKYKGSVATYADLPSTDQEVGDVYNVIDTGANYCWSGTEWDEIGAPIDLSQIMDLGTAQTATAKKTFSAGIASDSVEQVSPSHTLKLGNNVGFYINLDRAEAAIYYGLSKYFSISDDGGAQFNFSLETYLNTPEFHVYYGSDTYFVIDGTSFNIYKSLLSMNNDDLGSSTYKWKDLYLSGTIYLGTSGILKYENSVFSFNDDVNPAVTDNYDVGSSSAKWRNGYFSEIVEAKNTLNIIKNTDIVSNVLPQEKYDLMINGKPTIITGTYQSYTNALYAPVSGMSGTNYIGIGMCKNELFSYLINPNTRELYVIGTTTRSLGIRSVYSINGKEVPAYPSSTGTFVLKCVNGVLTWVQE